MDAHPKEPAADERQPVAAGGPATDEGRPVIAVDPGRDKCGLAVVYRSGRVAAQRIVPRSDLVDAVGEAVEQHAPVALVVGNRTASRACRKELETRVVCPIVFVDEHETTLRARDRYFKDHPPRGWQRLVPQGMLTPSRPLDDYAAVLLAERYWESHRR